MKKINQQIIDSEKGDCMRAVIASLLESSIEDIPNFIESREACNHDMANFLNKLGHRVCFVYKHNYTLENLIKIAKLDGGINGYLYASVPSQTYKDGNHAVVVDTDLNVVHDPNPNKKCLVLKPEDVTMILLTRNFIIPEHIKMKHEE